MTRFLISTLLITLFCVSGYSAKLMIEIPGFDPIGLEKKTDNTYVASIPKLGTYEFKGYFKSAKDFDMTAAVPAGVITDYIPGVGQILSLLGMDSVTLRLKQNGIGFGITLESGGLGALRGRVTETLSKVKALRVAINKIISQLEIKSLVMNGMIVGKTLQGDITGEISVIGKKISFSVDGELNMKKILDRITDKIIPAVSDFVAEEAKLLYKKTKELAKKAGQAGLKTAKNIYGDALKVAKDVGASMKHSSHSLNKCLNECTPKYANPQRERMLNNGNKVFQDFYNEIYNDIVLIEGKDAAETRRLRLEAISADWNEMVSEIDRGWSKMLKDDFVENFAFKDSSEKKLIAKYKSLVNESWDSHKNFRGGLLEKLLTYEAPVRIKRSPQETLDFIASLAKSGTPVTIELKTAAKAWDIQNHANGQATNGSQILFWDIYGAPNQQWYLVPAGKPNAYHIQSAMNGKFLHIGGAKDVKGTPIVLWDGARADAAQTVYTVSVDTQGYVHFITANGLAFDLENANINNGTRLRLWDNHGGDPEAFYIAPAVNPAPPLKK